MPRNKFFPSAQPSLVAFWAEVTYAKRRPGMRTRLLERMRRWFVSEKPHAYR